MAVAIGIDKDFEIVVLKDDGVILLDRGPDMRLIQFGADVKKLVIPEHLDACTQGRLRLGVAFDVPKRFRPGYGLPGVIVQFAVNYRRLGRAITDIAARMRPGTPGPRFFVGVLGEG